MRPEVLTVSLEKDQAETFAAQAPDGDFGKNSKQRDGLILSFGFCSFGPDTRAISKCARAA
jgi:hypothetical protein